MPLRCDHFAVARGLKIAMKLLVDGHPAKVCRLRYIAIRFLRNQFHVERSAGALSHGSLSLNIWSRRFGLSMCENGKRYASTQNEAKRKHRLNIAEEMEEEAGLSTNRDTVTLHRDGNTQSHANKAAVRAVAAGAALAPP